MPAGVQTWLPGGTVMNLDLTDRASRHIGYFDLAPGAAGSGSFSAPGVDSGTFYYLDVPTGMVLGEHVRCTVSGTTLNWSCTNLSTAHRIFYGVF
jgi:hypothetical protein